MSFRGLGNPEPRDTEFLHGARKTVNRQKNQGLASRLLQVIDFLGSETSIFLALGHKMPNRQKNEV